MDGKYTRCYSSSQEYDGSGLTTGWMEDVPDATAHHRNMMVLDQPPDGWKMYQMLQLITGI